MTRISDPWFRLRDYYTPPSLQAEPVIGADLDKLHRPTLKLVDYIHPTLATPPPAIRWEMPEPESSPEIVATVAVDASNVNECRIAIDEFAELQVAVALPLTARRQKDWAVVGDPGTDSDSKPGSWGGHEVSYREYDAETFMCVTWGDWLLITVPFHRDYAREAHVVVTRRMLVRQGIGPSGVDWDELIADVKAMPFNPKGPGAPRLGLV
jgi:hypothetical protein